MGLGGGSGACSWPGRAGDGEGRWKVGVDSGMKRLFEPGIFMSWMWNFIALPLGDSQSWSHAGFWMYFLG